MPPDDLDTPGHSDMLVNRVEEYCTRFRHPNTRYLIHLAGKHVQPDPEDAIDSAIHPFDA